MELDISTKFFPGICWTNCAWEEYTFKWIWQLYFIRKELLQINFQFVHQKPWILAIFCQFNISRPKNKISMRFSKKVLWKYVVGLQKKVNSATYDLQFLRKGWLHVTKYGVTADLGSTLYCLVCLLFNRVLWY